MLELIGRLWRERKLSPGQESEQQKAQAEANRSSGNCRASELRSAADVASRILQNRTNKEYFRNTTLDLARALEEAPPIDLCDLRDVDGFLKSMVKQYLDALSKRDIETATNALKWITEVVFCRNALSTCPGRRWRQRPTV